MGDSGDGYPGRAGAARAKAVAARLSSVAGVLTHAEHAPLRLGRVWHRILRQGGLD